MTSPGVPLCGIKKRFRPSEKAFRQQLVKKVPPVKYFDIPFHIARKVLVGSPELLICFLSSQRDGVLRRIDRCEEDYDMDKQLPSLEIILLAILFNWIIYPSVWGKCLLQ